MNDHSELKRLAEAAPEGPWFGPEYAPNTGYVFDNCLGSLLHYESIETEQDACLRYVAAANPTAVLALIAENEALEARLAECAEFIDNAPGDYAEIEALRSKITTVHFVCDQLPGLDGCRFIELENPQGESLGDESGKWEIRPDGLAQLVVEIASPDVKNMAVLLECAQGDLKQAMQIIEKDSKPLDDLIAENEMLCSKIASMNASGFGEAFYQVAERLGVTGARPVSPMQVFNSEVLPALDRAIKDTERLDWLTAQGEMAEPGQGDVRGFIDAAMSKEVLP